MDPVDNITALDQVMAWCLSAWMIDGNFQGLLKTTVNEYIRIKIFWPTHINTP